MFGYAKDHQPCVIFMDEVDAIGGLVLGGTNADEKFNTLVDYCNWTAQSWCGEDCHGHKQTRHLDPALLRPGRLDRKIEIHSPTRHRLEI